MKNPADQSEGFAVGTMLTAVVYTTALAFFINVDVVLLPTYMTVWAAVMALGSAWLTVRAVRDQIQSNIDLEQERERKKLTAAKAILPLLLSEITEISSHNIRRNFPNDVFSPEAEIKYDFQPIEWETIEKIKDSSPNFPPAISQRLDKILSIYQIMKSRDKSRSNTLISADDEFAYGENNAIDSAINWAVIHSMTVEIYPYSRGIEDINLEPINSENVENSLFTVGIVAADNSKLSKIIKEREIKNQLEFDFSSIYRKYNKPISNET